MSAYNNRKRPRPTTAPALRQWRRRSPCPAPRSVHRPRRPTGHRRHPPRPVRTRHRTPARPRAGPGSAPQRHSDPLPRHRPASARRHRRPARPHMIELSRPEFWVPNRRGRRPRTDCLRREPYVGDAEVKKGSAVRSAFTPRRAGDGPCPQQGLGRCPGIVRFEGSGRWAWRQQGDATPVAPEGLSGAAALPVPVVCSSLRGPPRPPAG